MRPLEHFLITDDLETLKFQYQKLSVAEKKELYRVTATAMYDAVRTDNVKLLRKLSQIASVIQNNTDTSTLKAFEIEFYHAHPHLNRSLIIYACKYQAVQSLRFLFQEIGRAPKITDKDSENHTAFYYALQSNNVELLHALIHDWPLTAENDTPETASLSTLHDILYQPFIALRKSLSPEMTAAVIRELQFNHLQRAIEDTKTAVEKNELSLENVHLKIASLITLVRQLVSCKEGYVSLMDPTYRADLLTFSVIAKLIRFLKRALKGTYTELPWEQLEFLLTQLVPFSSKQQRLELLRSRAAKIKKDLEELATQEKEALKLSHSRHASPNHAQRTLLNQIQKKRELAKQILATDKEEAKELLSRYIIPASKKMETVKSSFIAELEKFAHALEKIKEKITPEELGKSIPQGEIQPHTQFIQIHDFFEPMKEEHTLQHILRYLNHAKSADTFSLKGYLTIWRTVQVLGEYVKNTHESPHLSKRIEKLLNDLGIYTAVFSDLRDPMSHGYSLAARKEIEQYGKNLIADIGVELKELHELFEKILTEIHSPLPPGVPRQLPTSLSSKTSIFEKLRQKLEKTKFLTQEQKDKAFKMIPEEKRRIAKIKKRLLAFFSKKITLTEPRYNALVDQLECSVKDKESLKEDFSDESNWDNAKRTVENSRGSFKELRAFLYPHKESATTGLPEKNLKELLLKVGISRKEDVDYWLTLNRILLGKQAHFLNFSDRIRNRLATLHTLLEVEFPKLDKLLEHFSNEHSPLSIQLKSEFMLMYEKDEALQIALESLVFEISQLFQEKGLLEHISNVHIRNYLAHGDPLADAMSADPLLTIVNTAFRFLQHSESLLNIEKLVKMIQKNTAAQNYLLLNPEISNIDLAAALIGFFKTSDEIEAINKVLTDSNADNQKILRALLDQKERKELFDELPFPDSDPTYKDFAAYYDHHYAWQTLENQTFIENYEYPLQQADIARIARIEYGYENNLPSPIQFEVVNDNAHFAGILRNYLEPPVTPRPLGLIINLNQNHWVALVVHQDAQGVLHAHYRDSYGHLLPDHFKAILVCNGILEQQQHAFTQGVQQTDGVNCGLFALENLAWLVEHIQAPFAGAAVDTFFNQQPSPTELINRRIVLSERLLQDNAGADINALNAGIFGAAAGGGSSEEKSTGLTETSQPASSL